jgi:hypothetical protein
VGPRDVLDVVVKRKIPKLRRESNPSTSIIPPARSLFAISTGLSRLFPIYDDNRRSGNVVNNTLKPYPDFNPFTLVYNFTCTCIRKDSYMISLWSCVE